jgi:hypothetical protein
MKRMHKRFSRILSLLLIVLTISVSSGLLSIQPAFASTLSQEPNDICDVYRGTSEADKAKWRAVEMAAAGAIVHLTADIASASAAGAGSLAGYAGTAAAVSHLGLGGITTAIAGMMGSHAAGAAATALVTSLVGGPLIMGALIAGGVGVAAYGKHKLEKSFLDKFTRNELEDWAAEYCMSH